MINDSSLKVLLKEYIDNNDYQQISALKELCTKTDGAALKLELDYKLEWARSMGKASGDVNEFLAVADNKLVGYLGICHFGGNTFEVNGMVLPEYRRQGIFTKLYMLMLKEWEKRDVQKVLLLSDRNSISGQAFIQKTGAVLEHSEYEMFLTGEANQNIPRNVVLRKALNKDAEELVKQNAIYFGVELHEQEVILPEEEEKRGTVMFLAEAGEKTVGKVNLEVRNGVGGIYGLGILPEYRGKGYGRELLLCAIKKLKVMNAEKIMLQVALSNDRAQNLYQSCGFTATSIMDYFELRRH